MAPGIPVIKRTPAQVAKEEAKELTSLVKDGKQDSPKAKELIKKLSDYEYTGANIDLDPAVDALVETQIRADNTMYHETPP